MNKKKNHILKLVFYIFEEIKKQKKWTLLPIWILLLTVALTLLISGSAYLIPAIYIAF